MTFFRSLGAALGMAVFGAVLGIRLSHYLAEAGGALPSGGTDLANNVEAIRALPADVQAVVVQAWTDALHDVFLTALPFMVVAFVAALLIPERRLATRAEAETEAVSLSAD